MERRKALISVSLVIFLCLAMSAGHVVGSEEEYMHVSHVNLNNVLDSIEVEPGEMIDAEVWFEYVAPARAEDKPEIRVAFAGEHLGCLIEELDEAIHLGGPDYVRTFRIVAPTEPGTYRIMYGISEGCTCEEAKMLFNMANELGEVVVVKPEDNEDEECTCNCRTSKKEWDCIFSKEYYVRYINSDTIDRYSILFYQNRQNTNELRMEIDTREKYGIWSGSVSMSVGEDVGINYHTSKVWGIHSGEECFKEIDPNPSNAEGIAFFKLIIGFVPYTSLAMSLMECGEALKEPKEVFDVYDEVDNTWHFKNLSEVFTTTKYLNDRDVVTMIYPAGIIFDGKRAISVDFPLLDFQEECIHDVVFRIDGTIFGTVRHYIALPIEIGKQKREC